MDIMSLQYLTQTRRKLREIAETAGANNGISAFIAEELKRFGCKPKTVEAGVLCDIGRGKRRLAFYAGGKLSDENARRAQDEVPEREIMQIAILLSAARMIGAKSETPLRLIFATCGAERMIEAGATCGVEEIYALGPQFDLKSGTVGYCYGVMCAGRCEFDIAFSVDSEISGETEAESAAELTAESAFAAARKYGLTLRRESERHSSSRVEHGYSLSFYDVAKCEQAMLCIERAATTADDRFGATHFITSKAVYPPLVNDALAVDKVRSASEDVCEAIPPRADADEFALCLDRISGCMAYIGVDTQSEESIGAAMSQAAELFLKLVEMF